MGLLSRGSVQSYFYLFEGLGINSQYRVLFNVDEPAQVVTIVLVGEKRGQSLIVQGEEFTGHRESDSAE